MSSPDYIKVDSIGDVDPNKLSLSYVGKKFIDKDNNRFSIRFNRETRKMEIVKILIRQGGKIQEDVALRAWETTQKWEESDTKESLANRSPSQKPLSPPSQEISSINKDYSVSLNKTQDVPPDSKQYPKKSNHDSSQSPPSSQVDSPKTGAPSKNKSIRKNREDNWNFDGVELDLSVEPSFLPTKQSTSENATSNGENDIFSSLEQSGQNPQQDDNNANSESTKNNSSSSIESGAKSSENTNEKDNANLSVSEKWKDKNEKDKIDNIMKRLEEAKGRINSVLINIKSSRIFEVTGDPSENQNIIGNLTREFDVEVFQLLDDTVNYLKELTSYPRAISYYTAKYERSKRSELSVADEKMKLHMIIRWEMQEAFTKILEKLKALTLSLLNVLNLKSENHIKQLQYPNQLMFKDAKNATIYCSQDIDKLIQEVEDWKYDTVSNNNATK